MSARDIFLAQSPIEGTRPNSTDLFGGSHDLEFISIHQHHANWGDDNGSSHLRAALLKPSLTIPFKNGQLLTGTWQQIVLIDFDTRPRRRSAIFQFIGE